MRIYLLFSFLCIGVVSNAQQATVRKYTAPLSGSVVLRDVEDKYNAQVYSLEMPEPDADFEHEALQKVKAQVTKLYPHKRVASQNKSTTASAPIVTMGFVADSLSGIPPDNDMAISRGNKAVSVLNSNIAVLDGTNGKMSYRKSLKTVSSVVGLNTTNDNRYDPKVIYDPEADKYILIMLNGTVAYNYIVVGFSQSNDPSGKWNFYKFYGNYSGDTTWFDFPSISLTKDEFFFTGNKIVFDSSWQAGFKQTVIYQVNKKQGYDSAANLTYHIWENINYNGKNIRNLYPVKAAYDQLLGPEQYFLSNRNFDVQNDTIFLVKVPDIISSGNTNLTVTALKAPISYGVPPSGRQSDTAVTLATNDARILGAYAVDDEIQFVSATVDPVSGSSAVYHGEIYFYKTAPYIKFAHIYAIDTLDFGFPNISFAGNPWGLNQSLISFDYTGPNTFAGLGAVLFNGLEYSDLVKVKEGDNIIDRGLPGKEERWGDYTGAQPDYTSYGSMWVLGIYGHGSNKNYGNWMAKLNSPLLKVQGHKPQQVKASLYPNPTFKYVRLEFELEKAQAVSFDIYNAQGQLVDRLLRQKCEEGKNLLQFNTAPLSAGNYYIKAVSDNGAQLTTLRFIKQ
jgi:hypothetical protein